MEILPETSYDVQQINNLIRSRRSVFVDQFIPGKQIPDSIVRQLLENANWAPNHKHTEPWRFTVFSGEGLRQFADFQANMYKKTAAEKFKEDKWIKFQKTPLLCSHIIALGMHRSIEADIPEIEEIAAVACAVQNIYLSATAYGIGGYWSTGGVTYMHDAKSFFGLGETDKLMGFFYLGFIQSPSPKSKRGPVEEKTRWVQ